MESNINEMRQAVADERRQAVKAHRYPRLDHNYRTDMRASFYERPFVSTHYRKSDGIRARLITPVEEDNFLLVELDNPRRTTLIRRERFLSEWSSVK